LESLGLGNITPITGVKPASAPRASFGKLAEVSKGKDSTTGHWEIAGLITEKEFPTFPRGFPTGLLDEFLQVTGCTGYLGNIVASGTVIIRDLGAEHVKTGYPIVYTSADSVFQIAAHEEVIPLPDLYRICQLTREQVCVGDFAVGRVIARPFVGTEGKFARTANRKDFSLQPHGTTLLDLLMKTGIETVSIGKVDDLFAGRGLETKLHTKSNAEGIECIVREGKRISLGLIFANLVDFDMLYGHRNDPKGFASALEEFDRSVPAIVETLGAEDMLVITADHGNDPVTPSTDHSREYAPLLCMMKSKKIGTSLGIRRTFADIGKTVAEFFGVSNSLAGKSFLSQVC
jgi:phosphopentomutase